MSVAVMADGFDWSQLLADKGIAVVALVAIGVGVWRICKFIAPLAVNLATGHANLMETLQTTLVRQAQAAEDHTIKLDQHGHTLEEHGKKLSAISRAVKADIDDVAKPTWPTMPPLQPHGG